MSKKIILPALLTILISFSYCSMSAQELDGTWQGRISVLLFKEDVRMVIHISRDSIDHSLVATLDIPDQDLKNKDVDIEAKGDSLFLYFPLFSGDYSAKYYPDSNAYIGVLKQRGFKANMKLLKGEADDLVYNRPQKPKKPYPYLEEEVRIENKKANLVLAGTFTRPKENGKYPVVIMITGSGPEDRNETIYGHKPFLIIADELTKRGFGVLRCDDRGTAKSTGTYGGTSADFGTDVDAQVEYLKTRKDVDTKRIGLLGHSEGGLIAPYVATQRNDIGFMVLLAAPAMDLFNLLLIQDSLALMADGESAAYVHKSVVKNQKLFEYVRASTDSAMAADSIDKYLSAAKVSDWEISSTLRKVDSKWMRWFINYSPETALTKIKCPVLAINGEKDVQVPAEINIGNIRKALTAGGNKNFRAEVLPGLNHLFQHCKKCSVEEYSRINETMDASALNEICTWMEANVKKR
jgi:alpha-beta hydrolase superfamily lysophospholipase